MNTNVAGYNYGAPLRWLHDLRDGTEVAHIPPQGRVFFFDEKGPVLRLDDVKEARWLVKQIHFNRTGITLEVRITRLVGTHPEYPGDGYFFVLPNPGQPLVIHCTREGAHDGCLLDTCMVLESAVDKWIKDPIVAAIKGA